MDILRTRRADWGIGRGFPPLFILGPCVIEGRDECLRVADAVAALSAERPDARFIFKASYDKANRTAGNSPRGVGQLEGLAILDEITRTYGLATTTDVHSVEEVEAAASIVDLVQIPAMLSRQTSLLYSAAIHSVSVNVKKGQFMSPTEVGPMVDKLRAGGAESILVTERGFSFGYGNLVVDFRSIPLIGEHAPAIIDATHSCQLPGALGNRSGGERKFVKLIARAGVAAGASGVFIETHPDPDHAPSDGPNMIPLNEVAGLVDELIELKGLVERHDRLDTESRSRRARNAPRAG